MTLRSVFPKYLAVLPALVFALCLCPAIAHAATPSDEGASLAVGTLATDGVVATEGEQVFTQDSPDYIPESNIKVGTTYNCSCATYQVHMFRFTSTGSTYTLSVNGKAKNGYLTVCAWKGKKYTIGKKFLIEFGECKKGSNTFKIGKIKKGTVVTLQFTGSTSDKCSFKVIDQAKAKKDISNAKVSGLEDKTYTGKALKPSFTVKYGSKKLTKGKDYTVAYSNNVDVGKATVKITGKGNYKGTLKKTFKVKPKGKIRALVYGAAKNESPNSTNNVNLMSKALKGVNIPGYSWASSSKVKVVDTKGFSKSGFDNTVKKTFAKTTSDDISIVYLNTHSKAYTNVDFSTGLATGPKWDDYYSWNELMNYLADNIKGKVIFLPEVCNSGNFVTVADSNMFTARNRFAVISAANEDKGANQPSLVLKPAKILAAVGGVLTVLNFADNENTRIYLGKGKYTTALAKALGQGASKLVADGATSGVAKSKKDGKVTLDELYHYIKNSKGVKSTGQSPMRHIGSAFKKFYIYEKK